MADHVREVGKGLCGPGSVLLTWQEHWVSFPSGGVVMDFGLS